MGVRKENRGCEEGVIYAVGKVKVKEKKEKERGGEEGRETWTYIFVDDGVRVRDFAF